jgi:hypothetical protein
MKLSTTAAVALPAFATAFYSKQEYVSGVVHADIMSEKLKQWDSRRANGDYDSKKWNGFKGSRVPCRNGVAEAVKGDPLQTFRCKDMDLVS